MKVELGEAGKQDPFWQEWVSKINDGSCVYEKVKHGCIISAADFDQYRDLIAFEYGMDTLIYGSDPFFRPLVVYVKTENGEIVCYELYKPETPDTFLVNGEQCVTIKGNLITKYMEPDIDAFDDLQTFLKAHQCEITASDWWKMEFGRTYDMTLPISRQKRRAQ